MSPPSPPFSTQPACDITPSQFYLFLRALRIVCLCLSPPLASGGEIMRSCGLLRCRWPLPPPRYNIHTYLNTYVHTYVHTYIHSYKRVHTYVHRYNTCLHTYITYVHYITYIRTYIHWFKGHLGTYGNELADQLAKAAAQNGDTSISYIKISKGTFISEIEEEEYKMAKTLE